MSVDSTNAVPRRFRGWGLVALGITAFGLAAAAYIHARRHTAAAQVTMSAGSATGLRHQLVVALANEAKNQGLQIRPVETDGWFDMVEKVDNGTLDFALIQGGFDLSQHKNLREAAPLHVEPLHLLVKQELYEKVSSDLQTLRGKIVNLGAGVTTGTYWLSQEVLSFIGLKAPSSATPGDYRSSALSPTQLLALRDRDRMPDAIFISSTLPAPAVRQLVAKHGFRLVALPFQTAFALGALEEVDPAPESAKKVAVLKEHIPDVVIPPFTYEVNPPVPASEIHTLGTRVLLITNSRTDPDTVSQVLDLVFKTRIARLIQPPLDTKLLQLPPEVPWHDGSLRYLERDQPLVTTEFVGALANAVTVGAPLLGSLFCLWQWTRQRSRFKREQSFESYIYKVTHIESQAMEVEVSTRLDLQALVRLQRELERIKNEALHKFADGEMEGAELMSSFLAHVNDARAYLTRLIIYQRDSLVSQLRIQEELRAARQGPVRHPADEASITPSIEFPSLGKFGP